MRRWRPVLAAALTLGVAVCALPRAAASGSDQFVPTVRCNEVVLHSKNGRGPGYGAVLGAVSCAAEVHPRDRL